MMNSSSLSHLVSCSIYEKWLYVVIVDSVFVVELVALFMTLYMCIRFDIRLWPWSRNFCRCHWGSLLCTIWDFVFRDFSFELYSENSGFRLRPACFILINWLFRNNLLNTRFWTVRTFSGFYTTLDFCAIYFVRFYVSRMLLQDFIIIIIVSGLLIRDFWWHLLMNILEDTY